MFVHTRGPFRLLAVTGMLLLLQCAVGCQMFDSKAGDLSTSKSILKPLVPSKDVIELEVYFIDRTIGDPLIGESLWRDLSPISCLQPETRKRLQEDGFRFSMAPSRLPRSLQSLLSLSNEENPNRKIVPKRYSIPAGQDSVVLISNPPDGTPLKVKNEQGEKKIDLQQAQCVFHFSGTRIDEGWIRLSITPEVRHGMSSLRPIATNNEWLYSEQQQCIPLHQHRLTAELNVGEVIVVGLDPAVPDSLASRFFRADVSKGIEKLVLIRVIGLQRIDPVMTGSSL